MAKITLTLPPVINWFWGGTTAKLCLFLDTTVTVLDSTTEKVLAVGTPGKLTSPHLEYDMTVTGETVTGAETIYIYSFDDSPDNTAARVAQLAIYDSDGKLRVTLLENFTVHSSFSSGITFAELENFNYLASRALPLTVTVDGGAGTLGLDDLTDVVITSAANDDILQRKAGSFVNRTLAQLKTDLSLSGTNTGDQDLSGYQATSGKDATGGYAGLTLFKINFKNVLNTFTSFFTNSNTAARTYTFPDRTGTIADDTDITNAKARANHTGTQLASTISDFNASALTAAPAETTTTIGSLINGATSKTTPVDADYLPLMDSAASNIMKKLSWANLKATAKTYFDTLYVIAANLGSGVATFLATPSSANLAAALTDEVGTGSVLFSDPVVNPQVGTSYSLQASDNGKIVECNNASAITVTVPTSLGSGFNCVVVQLGAGQVTLSPSSSTLRNRSGLKTAGQYAAVSILPTSTANTFIVSGDTTT